MRDTKRRSPQLVAAFAMCLAITAGCSDSSAEPAAEAVRGDLQSVATGPNTGPVTEVTARMRDQKHLTVDWVMTDDARSPCRVNWKYPDGGTEMGTASRAGKDGDRIRSTFKVSGQVAQVQVLC